MTAITLLAYTRNRATKFATHSWTVQNWWHQFPCDDHAE